MYILYSIHIVCSNQNAETLTLVQQELDKASTSSVPLPIWMWRYMTYKGVCMCVCKHICNYVCMKGVCMCVCMCICNYVYMHVYVCVCVCLYVCVCMHVDQGSNKYLNIWTNIRFTNIWILKQATNYSFAVCRDVAWKNHTKV